MLFTLPPDENSGSEKPHGQFEVALSAPVWTSSTVNDPSQAHIRFWGHSSSHEQVVEIPEEHNKTCAAVPITVGAYIRFCVCSTCTRVTEEL